MKNGVPWDVALGLYPHEAMAMAVIFGEFQGGEFDWHAMRWRDKE